MNDMKHMAHLGTVARDDVKALETKEATYQGSWKRRGGVGAFMMMARKWDRLEQILSGTWHYDVFTAIEAQTSYERDNGLVTGSDATVLAEVRDLRRYLMLVEAEMVARFEVEANRQKAADLGAIAKRGVMETERRVPRYAFESAVPHKAGQNDATSQIEESPPAPEPMTPRTPEDGGQHGSLAPWVCFGDYFYRKQIAPEMREKFWCRRAADVWALEPFVENFQIPRVIRDCYNERGAAWVLRPERIPPDAREYFPDLTTEKNTMEREALPEWQRVLYAWTEDKNKFELTDRAWHVEAA